MHAAACRQLTLYLAVCVCVLVCVFCAWLASLICFSLFAFVFSGSEGRVAEGLSSWPFSFLYYFVSVFSAARYLRVLWRRRVVLILTPQLYTLRNGVVSIYIYTHFHVLPSIYFLCVVSRLNKASGHLEWSYLSRRMSVWDKRVCDLSIGKHLLVTPAR